MPMETEKMEIGPRNEQLTTSQHSTRLSRWIGEQVTILAEAFGESLTPQRVKIYAADLADIDQARLAIAFQRAPIELNFFPKIAELRELAGAKAEDQAHVEAAAAWEFTNRYLQKHGVVIYDDDNRPPLEPRIDYALRRIGGLNSLNQITEKSRPFMFKDFCEAYRQGPIADKLTPQLNELFSYNKLTAPWRKQLTGKVAREPNPLPAETRKPILKTIPKPLTDAQVRDRREMLKQQVVTIASRRKP